MTDFLFCMPGWIDGVMSLADIAGIAPEHSSPEAPAEADRLAFSADVSALKEDMASAYADIHERYIK